MQPKIDNSEAERAIFGLTWAMLGSVPKEGCASGTLYALVMNHFQSVAKYNEIIEALVKTEALTMHENYLERGPKFEQTFERLAVLRKK